MYMFSLHPVKVKWG